jgi:hypothetical protein
MYLCTYVLMYLYTYAPYTCATIYLTTYILYISIFLYFYTSILRNFYRAQGIGHRAQGTGHGIRHRAMYSCTYTSILLYFYISILRNLYTGHRTQGTGTRQSA